MKKEKPLQVIPHGGKHRTETRVFARQIHESYCAQKGCKFYGRHAVQGVCHTTKTFCDSFDWSYIDRAIAEGRRFVREARRLYKGRDYIRYLEALVESHWANEVCRLDELVRMRRNAALMEHKLARLSKKESGTWDRRKVTHGDRSRAT